MSAFRSLGSRTNRSGGEDAEPSSSGKDDEPKPTAREKGESFYLLTNQIPIMAGERTKGEGVVLGQKISKGSNGTIVYDGTFHGRPVALKRFIKSFYVFAEREYRMLLSTVPPLKNIIQLYGREIDENFIYHALEPCDCSLSNFVKNKENAMLWSYPAGFPTSDLLMLISGIVGGLAQLHSRGFVLPDLKPSDVLMVGKCPKLSGRCIYLEDEYNAADGISQEISIDQIKAKDMFNLALVIYFCLGQGNSSCIPTDLVEFWELLVNLTSVELEERLKASEVSLHPLFWNSDKRLSFLKDAIVWVETPGNAALFQLDDDHVLAKNGWQDKIREDFLGEMERIKSCKYNTDRNSVRVILCIVRDTLDAYHTLPPNVQKLLGVMPEGVDQYFRLMFRALVIEVHKFMYLHCKQEEWFRKHMEIM